MKTRSMGKTCAAIALIFLVLFAQLGAMTAIAANAWTQLSSPSSPVLRFPFIQLATMLRDEIVIPMCDMRYVPGAMQNGNVNRLRFVNPHTGQIRDLDVSGCTSQPLGLVANGKTLWIICQKEVFETDGARVVKLDPNPTSAFKGSLPFLYEDHPALIERDGEGNFCIATLVDGEWMNVGRIALPGPNRAWNVDEQTGELALIPRTSAESNVKGLKPLPVRVMPIAGQFHIFQVERKSLRSNDDFVFGYRVGFDFIPHRSEDDPASAMAPVNEIADTAGWFLLDAKMTSDFPCQATQNGKLLLGNEHEIWQQNHSEGSATSTRFERIADLEKPENSFFLLNMVSSPETDEVYVLAGDLLAQVDVFQLRDRQLQKMPVAIEGMGAPIKRWLAVTLLREFAAICVATIAFVVIAAFFARTPTYSSGHDTVVLAPIIRRSLARCLDLILVFGPLSVQVSVLLIRTRFDVILKNIADFESLTTLLTAMAWSVVIWSAMVVSTGLWGVTPGKWLFGLRVVRTTLRPCGLPRALLRELLLWLDSPQFLTVVPGILGILISRNRQRIGDLAAGTLVIDSRH